MENLTSSFEQQVEQGNLFLHTSLSQQSARINEIESFLYAVIDILIKKGVAVPELLSESVLKIRQEIREKEEENFLDISLRADFGEEDREFVPVNCSERLPICKAVCCKLDFALNAEEIESGKIKWELGRPYFIRHEPKSCYCCHINQESKACNVYDHRPSVCKKYSCANDHRIWKDFDKMELNDEWLNENIKERKIKFTGAAIFNYHSVAGDKIDK
ncbi:hypothetical protein [Mucilaginibacter agri]|nr:hypothetical protein [Mucilaginibacter agri]